MRIRGHHFLTRKRCVQQVGQDERQIPCSRQCFCYSSSQSTERSPIVVAGTSVVRGKLEISFQLPRGASRHGGKFRRIVRIAFENRYRGSRGVSVEDKEGCWNDIPSAKAVILIAATRFPGLRGLILFQRGYPSKKSEFLFGLSANVILKKHLCICLLRSVSKNYIHTTRNVINQPRWPPLLPHNSFPVQSCPSQHPHSLLPSFLHSFTGKEQCPDKGTRSRSCTLSAFGYLVF